MNLTFKMILVPGLGVVDGLHCAADLAHFHVLGREGGVLDQSEEVFFIAFQALDFFGELLDFFDLAHFSEVFDVAKKLFDFDVDVVDLLLELRRDVFRLAAHAGHVDLGLCFPDFVINLHDLFREEGYIIRDLPMVSSTNWRS